MKRVACTIASLNYLPYAKTLCDSYLRVHPEHRFYVLVVDRLPDSFDRSKLPFEVVLVEELGIANFPAIAFKYNILELNTNVKPTFLKELFRRGADEVLYFDPDIQIFSRVDPIFEALQSAAIVLTPHAISPNDKHPIFETNLLRTGVYNLGFIGLSNTDETMRFLDWWETRCLELAFDESQTGQFVDQKWTNLVPCFFNSYQILKHPGCNVAYWNLHERSLRREADRWLVDDGLPLVFYHFSGVTLDHDIEISRHSPHLNLFALPEMVELFAEYRAQLVENGITAKPASKYAFAYFSNDTPVTKLQRAAFYANLDRFGNLDPFDSKGPFYAWAKRQHLQSVSDTSSTYNMKTYRSSDLRVRFVNSMLRWSLRILGADRYTVLMKYFGYISNLRNQKEIFG